MVLLKYFVPLTFAKPICFKDQLLKSVILIETLIQVSRFAAEKRFILHILPILE